MVNSKKTKVEEDITRVNTWAYTQLSQHCGQLAKVLSADSYIFLTGTLDDFLKFYALVARNPGRYASARPSASAQHKAAADALFPKLPKKDGIPLDASQQFYAILCSICAQTDECAARYVAERTKREDVAAQHILRDLNM